MVDSFSVDKNGSITVAVQDILHKYKEMEWIANFNGCFMYSHKDRYRKGREVLGEIKLFSDRDRLIHRYDYLITVSHSFWMAFQAKREALIYHELCHLFYDEETAGLKLVAHDMEEFYAVYKRFGDWQGELEKARGADVGYQLSLLELGKGKAKRG
jgi:Putative phage metallopeptidase